MSKGIFRRFAAFCAVVAVSGAAGLQSAQAASPVTVAPAKAAASVRVLADTTPTVKLGPALLEERTVTPGGLVVIHETVRGTEQSAQAASSQPSGHKA